MAPGARKATASRMWRIDHEARPVLPAKWRGVLEPRAATLQRLELVNALDRLQGPIWRPCLAC